MISQKIKDLWTRINSNKSLVHFVHAFLTQLLYDSAVGGIIAHIFFARDFSESAMYSLGYAVFSLLVRFLREEYKSKYAPEASVEVQRPAGSIDAPELP